ncbi:hypothetical protein [Prolixibacter sp. SD074]|jgi:hypothetical protein|uniref:hypothetical protein n=1 Tax=Prolixibacter sp. SD074 TaxID=2652391 RepID=UPI0012703D4F|nr:hypothetical protein [Prolixibacter sp. SD074]GET29350.1 hypothetical protein SD074_15520 [Prolixibacter sp. SD074]
MSYKTFNEQMESWRILIWNAADDAEIQSRLENYGYTPEKFDQGKALWQQTDQAGKQQSKELNEQTTATNSLNETREKAEDDLKRAKKIARVAFDGNKEAFNALNLDELNIYRFEDWLNDAEKFYANLLGNTQWAETMQTYSYTNEKLTAQQQEVDSLKSLQQAQQREMGEAQQSTQTKWKLHSQLKKWCNQLTELSKIEFEDDAQLLEKLGILVRS